MIVRNRMELDAQVDEVWRYVVNNVPSLARCIPGAELIQTIDERTYSGRIVVKLGPISVGFDGTVYIDELDEQLHTARLRAQGTEARARAGASASLRVEIHPQGEGSVVTLESDLELTGAAAQLGRTGIIQEIAQRLADRFAKCLEQEIKAQPVR